MPISSLVIDIEKGKEKLVTQSLAAFNTIEIYATRDDKIIIVTDTKTKNEDREIVKKINTLSGVITANMVFTNMEDCS